MRPQRQLPAARSRGRLRIEELESRVAPVAFSLTTDGNPQPVGTGSDLGPHEAAFGVDCHAFPTGGDSESLGGIALDAGDAAGIPCPDQDGVVRPQGVVADVVRTDAAAPGPTEVFFLHQSVGQGIMDDHGDHPGLVSQLEALGCEFGEYSLWDWPPGGSVPTEIATLFADANGDGHYGDVLETIAGAHDADVLMLKSCFYTLWELEDPAALAVWEQAFIDNVAPYANQHPDQKLVAMPAAPERRESGLSAAAAAHGRDWSEWLAGPFITTYTTQDNVYSFSLFDLLADPEGGSNGNYLRRTYCRSDHGDAHPNDAGYSAAADALTEFLRTNVIGDSGTHNHPPVAGAQGVETEEDTPAIITLTATDADLDPIAGWEVATAPARGQVSLDENMATYTPNEGWFGTDSFTFRAYDGQAWSSPATVTITVTQTRPFEIPLTPRHRTGFLDDDGSTVTLLLSGNGSGYFTLTNWGTTGAPIADIVLNDTTARTSLTIAAKGGATPGTSFQHLTITAADGASAALATLSAKAIGLSRDGSIQADNGIVAITLGNVGLDADISVDGGLNSLTIGGIVGGLDMEISGGVGKFAVSEIGPGSEISIGDAVGSLTVNGPIGAGTAITVGDGGIRKITLVGSADLTLRTSGALGTLTLKASRTGAQTLSGLFDVRVLGSLSGKSVALDRFTLRAVEGLGRVTVRSMSDTVLSGSTMGGLTVAGDVAGSKVLAGYDIGQDLEFGTDDDGGLDVGRIGAISVGGGMSGTSISAGVAADEGGMFGSGNHMVVATSLEGAIRSLTVRGTLTGSSNPDEHFGVVAHGVIGRVVVGRAALPLPWSLGNIEIASGIN